MSNLKESIKAIIANQEHYKAIDDFARKCFDEKLKDHYNGLQSWKSYEGFEVISETEIKVKYRHGAGDMEFYDDFIANVTE